MLPAPLDRSVIETLGPAFLKSYKPEPRFGYRRPSSCTQALGVRAAELGVAPASLSPAVSAFTRYANHVRDLPSYERKLSKRGYTQEEITRLGQQHRQAVAQRSPEESERLRKIRDFDFHVMSVPIAQRQQQVYARRYTDLYPGKRRPNTRYSEAPVSVEFVDSAEHAGGYGSGYLSSRKKAGNGTIRGYTVACRINIAKDDCRLIFSAGISKAAGKVTVAATESMSPALPAGFRGFEAAWVSAGRGFRINAQKGVILKTPRGAIEHYPDMDLAAALEARAKAQKEAAELRAKAVKPFRFSKSRLTVAERLERTLGGQALTGDLFAQEETRFELDF